jgi:hypothetical protein
LDSEKVLLLPFHWLLLGERGKRVQFEEKEKFEVQKYRDWQTGYE